MLGSKLFHILENLDRFAEDPAGMIFSTGGLTFYGGLIVAGLWIAWYVRQKGLRIPDVADAIAPSLLLGYGIGRIGCYLAGDGDWGICSSLANKPGWLPDWLWSETFPNNILNLDVAQRCALEYGPQYDGVFPTMLYEFAMAAALFGFCGRSGSIRSGADGFSGSTSSLPEPSAFSSSKSASTTSSTCLGWS